MRQQFAEVVEYHACAIVQRQHVKFSLTACLIVYREIPRVVGCFSGLYSIGFSFSMALRISLPATPT